MSGIKSVQYGTVSIAHNATTGATSITQVNMTKAILTRTGSHEPGGSLLNGLVQLNLSNSQTVTGVRAGQNNGATAGFCVLEFL
jgi:hypothetical protein